ncbi:MAG: M48 family metallopeptidase [Myxococcales bacterium]|nr:M48 family metallopeptidase [Myxococcales bacterium]
MLNVYGMIALAALLGEFMLGVWVDLLNLRAMRPDPPPGFEDVYDSERYRRSQEYTRARAAFAIWPRAVGLALVLVVWFAGGFEALDRALRALEMSPTLTGVFFIGTLVAGRAVMMLPFRYYSTFVIEERFNFNKSTLGTFFSDQLKFLLLGSLIGGPLLALVLVLFERGGSLAWLYCFAAIASLTLLLQFVAPAFIMPMFNRFSPLDEGALRDSIFGYAKSVGFPLSKLFVIDGSRRSNKANAFFTGFGRQKRIALFDTLVERHSVEELVGVVAHEIGHYKMKHIARSMVLSIAQMGLMLWLLGFFLGSQPLYSAFGISEPSVYTGLVFCSLLYTPVDLLLSLFMSARSRKHEYEADRYAAQTTGKPEALAAALKKLAADSLSNLTPHPAYVFLHHSHPPVTERVAALLSMARSPQ